MTRFAKPILHGRDHAPGGADPIPISFASGLPTIAVVFTDTAIGGAGGGWEIGLVGGTPWTSFVIERPDPVYLYRGTDSYADLVWKDYPAADDAIYTVDVVAEFYDDSSGTYRAIQPYQEPNGLTFPGGKGWFDSRPPDGSGFTYCRYHMKGQFPQDTFAVEVSHDATGDVQLTLEMWVTLIHV